MTTFVQKHGLLVPDRAIIALPPGRASGHFRIRVRRSDGTFRVDTGWFQNLVTTPGLNRWGTGGRFATSGFCHVGTGTGAPNVNDTSLDTFVAANDGTDGGWVHDTQSSAPYYASSTRTFTFSEGLAEGNLSEVAMSWTDSPTGPLWSRALILDGGGSPTTITVLSNEVLFVSFQQRFYPPTDDVPLSIADSGPAGTTHDVVVRAANVTSAGYWSAQSSTIGSAVQRRVTTDTNYRVFDGALGAITGLPSGSNSSSTSQSIATYGNNDLYRDFTCVFGLGAGNFGGGVQCLEVGTSAGSYQMSFDPVIPKTSDDVLTFTFRVAWDRFTPL